MNLKIKWSMRSAMLIDSCLWTNYIIFRTYVVNFKWTADLSRIKLYVIRIDLEAEKALDINSADVFKVMQFHRFHVALKT